MDIERESELFWIARDSLKAPLPKDWKPWYYLFIKSQSEDGNIYYFNFVTGESIWDHPCDETFREMYKTEKEKLVKSKEQFNTKDEKTFKVIIF